MVLGEQGLAPRGIHRQRFNTQPGEGPAIVWAETRADGGYWGLSPEKLGERIQGIPVAGTRHDIRRLIEQYRIDMVVLAISSLSVQARREMMAQCEGTSARVKIVPALSDLLTGDSGHALFRDAGLEDLLGQAAGVVQRQ